MSETLVRPVGSGTGGAYVGGTDHYTADDANQMRILLNKLGFATLQRNIVMGGSKTEEYRVNADGDYDLIGWVPIIIDNRSTQFSGFTDSFGASLILSIRALVRVSDPAITGTPKIRYGSTFGAVAVAGTGTVATISGAAACSTIAEDFSDTNQYQSLTLTLPTGSNIFKPQITIAGTGGNPYSFWALFLIDLYMDSTP